jgi:hypothetical protein
MSYFLSAPNGRLDGNPDYLLRLVVQYGRTRFPSRQIAERKSLYAVSPPAEPGEMERFEVLWDNRPDIAAQMLWFTYGDPTCRIMGDKCHATSTPCSESRLISRPDM